MTSHSASQRPPRKPQEGPSTQAGLVSVADVPENRSSLCLKRRGIKKSPRLQQTATSTSTGTTTPSCKSEPFLCELSATAPPPTAIFQPPVVKQTRAPLLSSPLRSLLFLFCSPPLPFLFQQLPLCISLSLFSLQRVEFSHTNTHACLLVCTAHSLTHSLTLHTPSSPSLGE